MIVNTKDLYSFEQAAEILGVSNQRLFELSTSPYINKFHVENGVYLTKESVRRLVLREDV